MFCHAAKSLQSCPTLCDPRDGSPPGSAVPGILQARTLERVAISFSIAWKWKVKVKSRSHVRLVATPWTAAYQAPPSMGFSRQEYWSGLPLPSPMFCHSCCQFCFIMLLLLSHSVSNSLRPYRLSPRPWDFPGKNTGVSSHFLVQGIFLTQGLNPCLLHCRWILYH